MFTGRCSVRFGLLTGATTGTSGEGLGFDPNGPADPKYRRHDLRFPEMLEECVFAEKMGFDFVSCPEQHFLPDYCATSAAEVIYGALAVLTTRVRIRSLVTLLVFPINHPIRVAEQAATIDILSKGRYEIGTGRSNQALQLDAFGVPVNETRQRWAESVRLICAAFLNDPFTFDSDHFHIPERSLVPKPVQKPHPPLFVACTSTATASQAGRWGMGVVAAASYAGFDVLQAICDAYRDGLANVDPVGGFVTSSLGVAAFPALCMETTEEAREVGRKRLKDTTSLNDVIYAELAKQSPDYAYMKDLTNLERLDDIDYIAEQSASAVIGSPDDCIRQIKRFEAMGVEEITLGVDGFSHDEIMRSLELFGKYVIPKFEKVDLTYARVAVPKPE